MAHKKKYRVSIDGKINANAQEKQRNVWLLVALSLFETLLFGGLPYGWGTLLFVFKDEGIYADLCQDESQNVSLSKNSSNYDPSYSGIIVCAQQDERFNLWFAIAITTGNVSTFIIGYISQIFGTTKTRIIFILVFVGGALCLAFTSEALPWLVLPGLALLSAGGFSLLVTNIRVSTFLNVGAAVYIGLLCGCFDTSTIMTRVIKALYENEVNREYAFVGLAILHIVISGINTAMHSRITIHDTDMELEVNTGIDNKLNVLENEDSPEGTYNEIIEDKNSKEKEQTTIKSPEAKLTIKTHLTSSLYILHLMFMSIMVLKFFFFLGSINKQLEDIFSNKSDVGHFTDVMAYTLMGGIFGSFISGSLLEWQKRIFSDSKTEQSRRLLPQIVPLLVCGVLVILLSALSFLSTSNALYILFVNLLLLRSFMYAVNMGYITNVFPSEFTSVLYGVGITTSAIFGLLQYGLFIWMDAYKNALNHVNILFLVLGVLSLLHPLDVFIKARRSNN